jgi:hypothetical protein
MKCALRNKHEEEDKNISVQGDVLWLEPLLFGAAIVGEERDFPSADRWNTGEECGPLCLHGHLPAVGRVTTPSCDATADFRSYYIDTSLSRG